MAYKNKRKREREAAKQQAFAERIESVITDPMYEKIQDILKGTDAKTFDEARTAINRHSRKVSKEDPSDLLRFLKENEDIVFNPDIDFDAINKEVKAGTFSPTNSETTSTTKNKNTGESNSSKKRKQKAQEATEEAAEKATKKTVKEGIDELGPSNLKKIFNKRVFDIGLNAAFAISDYKDARDSGKGVVGSAVKAGALFAAGEVLQGVMFPGVLLAGAIPKMAVGAIETTQKMTRQMNNMQRIQTFGESYFQDTQQLATMRQAGMELAKMSQYNLQQSIMGNEAQYMHKL